MLEISEIFGPTIQGEGKRIGTPSIFIRFCKCNLNCKGFKVKFTTLNGTEYGCDTYYAVNKNFKDNWVKHKSYKDIIKKVDDIILKNNIEHKIDIVITGGEPLLYWNNKDFQKLIKFYTKNNHKVTIETNASLKIDFIKKYQKKILFSMSPKLSNSGENYKKRINKETITKIIENTKNSYLKFVIDKNILKESQEEILNITKNIPKCEIYLMPQAKNKIELNENSLSVIKMAINNNYIYSDRLHIRIWDSKRGV